MGSRDQSEARTAFNQSQLTFTGTRVSWADREENNLYKNNMLNRSYHHIHRIILPAGDALVGGAHAVVAAGVCVWLGVEAAAAAAVTPSLHPPLVQSQQRHEPGHLGGGDGEQNLDNVKNRQLA